MLRWVGVAVAVTFLGCSSSGTSNGGASSCTGSASCGGNLVGTWNFVNACETAAAVQMMNSTCPAESAQAGAVDVSGTVTFNADMTYSIALVESVAETLNIPNSCLTSNGITLTCEQLAQSFNSVTSGVDAGFSPTTCASSGSGCTCTLSASTANINETGTYTTSGGNYTTTPSSASGNGPGSGTYCVSGNTLHVAATAAGDGGSGSSPVTFVATKQ